MNLCKQPLRSPPTAPILMTVTEALVSAWFHALLGAAPTWLADWIIEWAWMRRATSVPIKVLGEYISLPYRSSRDAVMDRYWFSAARLTLVSRLLFFFPSLPLSHYHAGSLDAIPQNNGRPARRGNEAGRKSELTVVKSSPLTRSYTHTHTYTHCFVFKTHTLQDAHITMRGEWVREVCFFQTVANLTFELLPERIPNKWVSNYPKPIYCTFYIRACPLLFQPLSLSLSISLLFSFYASKSAVCFSPNPNNGVIY